MGRYSVLFCYFALCSFLVLCQGQGNCSKGTDCDGIQCVHWYDFDNALVAPLNGYKTAAGLQFDAQMGKATKIAETFGKLFPPEFDAGLNHMTWEYFCCGSLMDYLAISNLLQTKFSWPAINVTFERVGCTTSPSPNFVSLVAWADAASQQRILDAALQLESFLMAHGFPVQRSHKDMMPFHSTIGAVMPTAGYPVEKAVDAINAAIPGPWNPEPLSLTEFMFVSPPFSKFNPRR